MASDSGIFISYRRELAKSEAGRLADALVGRFGEDRVFMDVEGIALGLDFHEVIDERLSWCEVMLAVICEGWLDITDERGNRRLDDPEDFNRLEIEKALERDIRVVPILFNGAKIPRPAELPPSLAGFSRRQAFSMEDDTFRPDVARLIDELDKMLKPRVTVEVAEHKDNLRDFDIRLGGQSYKLVLEVHVWSDRIVLDGKVIVKKRFFNGEHRFVLGQGTAAAPVVCRIVQAIGTGKIEDVELTIDGEVVYSESNALAT